MGSYILLVSRMWKYVEKKVVLFYDGKRVDLFVAVIEGKHTWKTFIMTFKRYIFVKGKT